MKKRISCIIALLIMMTASGCGSRNNVEKLDSSSNAQQEQKDKTNTDNSQITEKIDENVQNPLDAPKPSEDGMKKQEEERSNTPSNSTNTNTTDNINTKTPTTETKPTTTTKPQTPTTTKPTTTPPITKPTPPPTTPPTTPPVEEVKVSVSDIMNKVTQEIEFPAMMDLKKEEMRDFYYINPDDVEEYIIKTPMMNVMATEMAIIKVKDERNVESVKEDIDKHVKDLERIWEQYLPHQYELVKKHILKSNGQYIILIIHEDAEQIEGIFDSFFKK